MEWLDDRTGLVKLTKSIADHPAAPGVKWKYVFGSAVLTAFIMQVVSGIGLLTTYVSSTGSAFESLQYITEKAPLGAFLRGMHYWGASMMVVLIAIHVLRIFLMGSFKFPRELNWITGVLLLATTAAMAFCGQIMRWDQNAVFGIVAASKMASHVPLIGTWLSHFIIGGDVVGSYTLSRIFDMHVFVLPILLVVPDMPARVPGAAQRRLRTSRAGPRGGSRDVPFGLSRHAAKARRPLLADCRVARFRVRSRRGSRCAAVGLAGRPGQA